MAAIYYEKNPGALVATGKRTVSTYPSGLCRIDRTYVCPEYAADAARLALQVGEELPDDDGKPAMDGAFISPAPQETRRGDGFVEFAVSAYGRTNETGIFSVSNVDIVGNANVVSIRTVKINYVKTQNESAIVSPRIDPSITIKSAYSRVRNRLAISGDQLQSQDVILYTIDNLRRGTSLDFYKFSPLVLSFVGTGTVEFSGVFSEIVTGEGENVQTSKILYQSGPPTQASVISGYRSGSEIQITVTGDVRIATLTDYVDPRISSDLSRGFWMQTAADETDYGYFKDVSASFRSI